MIGKKLLIINGITCQNIKEWEKVGGANGMSRWRNRPAPLLADNPVSNIPDPGGMTLDRVRNFMSNTESYIAI